MPQTTSKPKALGSVFFEQVWRRSSKNYRNLGNKYYQLPYNLRECMSNYYPFGSSLPTRSWSDASKAYRYGFNSKEKDSETASDDYDFGARIYDARLGRWMSVDFESAEYPSLSAYVSLGNSPILFIDIDGNKILIAYQEPKKDENGNFVVDPENGNLIMVTKYYAYGSKLEPPDNVFVKQAIESLNYLAQTSIGRKEIRKAQRNRREIKIIEIDPYGMNDPRKLGSRSQWFAYKWSNPNDPSSQLQDIQYDKNGSVVYLNEIYWYPNSKIEVIEDKGEITLYGTGTFISAATSLGHEIRHTNLANKNPLRALKLLNKIDFAYDNKEERRVIRWERRLIRKLNNAHDNFETVRYNHRGSRANNDGKTTDTSARAPRNINR